MTAEAPSPARNNTGDQPKKDRKANLRVGGGRPKGVPNKNTTMLKDALLAAADRAGGKEGLIGYLTTQAKTNPQSFLPLLGKVLPLQVAAQIDQNVTVRGALTWQPTQ